MNWKNFVKENKTERTAMHSTKAVNHLCHVAESTKYGTQKSKTLAGLIQQEPIIKIKEVITTKELIKRYELYCLGDFPQYEKEHLNWLVIE